MPEEIQIQDPDGSAIATTASTGQARQKSAETTLRSLSAAESDRLSLEQLEAREARYGVRKAMGPTFSEEPETNARTASVEEISESQPRQLQD